VFAKIKQMEQFTTLLKMQSGWDVVLLEDQISNTRVEIVPVAGAILNGFEINKTFDDIPNRWNIIDGYDGLEDFKVRVHSGFRSAKLSPFVCRLKNGKYTWKGIDYTIDKFMLNGSALHGLLYDAPFQIVGTHSNDNNCSVEMEYIYKGELAGYPFPYRCRVSYILSENNTLEISTKIENLSTETIPITDGWHPYFKLRGIVDDYWLQIASNEMLEYDDILLPTGNYTMDNRFEAGRKIGDAKIDNGFRLNKQRMACTLLNPESNIKIEWLNTIGYPFLQVYIPEDRKSIAIENLSSSPDAFNNGIGLIHLEPKVLKFFETKFMVSY
jgi:aldose 1-epimerase